MSCSHKPPITDAAPNVQGLNTVIFAEDNPDLEVLELLLKDIVQNMKSDMANASDTMTTLTKLLSLPITAMAL